MNLKPYFFMFLSSFLYVNLFSQKLESLDVQGHRGIRGYYPENSIFGFCKAVEMGVTTIELDVVISKDAYVLVSHEPYLNSAICSGPNGEKIDKMNEKDYNLYLMNYAEIQKCDCGSKGNVKFPKQVKIASNKPTLEETFSRVEYFIAQGQYEKVRYNIEIKSSLKDEGVFQPNVQEFVRLVAEVILKFGLENRAYIQSFDSRVLEEVHLAYPSLQTSLLVDFSLNPKKELEKLSFVPNFLSPNYRLVSKELLKYCKAKGVKLVPWTVNDKDAILSMLEMGVDGIISDYPDLVLELANIKKRSH